MTSILISFLTYSGFKYLIDLSTLKENENIDLPYTEYLFRNKTIYKLIKTLSNKNKIKNELQNLISTSPRKNSKKYFNTENLDTNNRLNNEIKIFVKKFSKNFIEIWYKPNVSANDQFFKEAQEQLEIIFIHLFDRFKKTNKFEFFKKFAYIFDNNFLNIAIAYNSKQISQIPNEILHPAVRNSPHSETIYLKRFVQIILRKSGSNLNLTHPLVEELFLQVIGKNCLENLVRVMIRPNFLYYIAALLINNEKTNKEFYSIQVEINKIEKTTDSLSTSFYDEDPNNFSSSMTSSLIDGELLEKKMNDLDTPPKTIEADSEQTADQIIQPANMLLIDQFDNLNIQILNLVINRTETNYEPKTSNKYTSYILQVFINFLIIY